MMPIWCNGGLVCPLIVSETAHSPFLMHYVSARGKNLSNFKGEGRLCARYDIIIFVNILMIFQRECNQVQFLLLDGLNKINEINPHRTQTSLLLALAA